jgi:cytochrome c5
MKENEMKTNKIMMIACTWLTIAATPLYAATGEEVFNKTCKMCHGSGVMNAPKAGDVETWKPRLAKGREALYESAINGFRDKGVMPPKGGNGKLTDDEVKAAVDYMLGLVE